MTLTGSALAAYLDLNRKYGGIHPNNFHLYIKMGTKFKYDPNAKRTSGVWRWNGERFVEVKPPRALTGAEMARFSNPARQRKKGPLVRFGRMYEH